MKGSRWEVAAIAWGAAVFLALATATQTYLSMWTHGHSFARILLWQLGCWSFWAAVAPWIVAQSTRRPLWKLALLGVALTVAQSLLASQLAIWLQPYQPFVTTGFRNALGSLWRFLVVVGPLVFALIIVAGRGFAAYQRTRQLEVRKSQLETQLARAQLDALRLEIQPHFLFNTLNSIAALIRVNDNPAALAMLLELSELMRATLDDPKGPVTPLGRELQLIRRYVELQRVRFGDRLTVSIQADEDSDTLAVPTLLLQPLVENALRHGFAPNVRACRISITASARDGILTLRVEDDGAGLPPGFDVARQSRTGLGNTRERLERLYGDAAILTVARRSEGGTLVEVRMPAHRVEAPASHEAGAA